MSSNLKIIFSEIVRGYSTIPYNKSTVYLKHLNQLDSSNIDLKRQEYIEYFVSKGLLSYEDKLAEIIKSGDWSKEKDKEIEELKSFIVNLKHSKEKYTTKKDKAMMDKEIHVHNDRMFKLVIEKEKLIGKTADGRANKKIEEYYMYISLFKDETLQKLLFSEEEFDLLDDLELLKLNKIYRNKTKGMSEDSLKRIALMPYFFNLFTLAGDNLINLFGKPIIYLTNYQVELIQYAKHYKYILQNSKTSPPPEILSNPEKLLEWFHKGETLQKIVEGPETPDTPDKEVMTSVKSVVGMSKEEMKEVGIDTSSQDKLTEELKKKGELTFQEMAKLGLL